MYLPSSILLNVISYLDLDSYLCASLVCHEWFDLCVQVSNFVLAVDVGITVSDWRKPNDKPRFLASNGRYVYTKNTTVVTNTNNLARIGGAEFRTGWFKDWPRPVPERTIRQFTISNAETHILVEMFNGDLYLYEYDDSPANLLFDRHLVYRTSRPDNCTRTFTMSDKGEMLAIVEWDIKLRSKVLLVDTATAQSFDASAILRKKNIPIDTLRIFFKHEFGCLIFEHQTGSSIIGRPHYRNKHSRRKAKRLWEYVRYIAESGQWIDVDVKSVWPLRRDGIFLAENKSLVAIPYDKSTPTYDEFVGNNKKTIVVFDKTNKENLGENINVETRTANNIPLPASVSPILWSIPLDRDSDCSVRLSPDFSFILTRNTGRVYLYSCSDKILEALCILMSLKLVCFRLPGRLILPPHPEICGPANKMSFICRNQFCVLYGYTYASYHIHNH